MMLGPEINEAQRRIVAILESMSVPYGFRVEDGDAGVWVTTVEDLILLKMIFHRDKDLVDVRGLIAANRSSIDRAYVESWITKTLTEDAGKELRDMLRLP